MRLGRHQLSVCIVDATQTSLENILNTFYPYLFVHYSLCPGTCSHSFPPTQPAVRSTKRLDNILAYNLWPYVRCFRTVWLFLVVLFFSGKKIIILPRSSSQTG